MPRSNPGNVEHSFAPWRKKAIGQCTLSCVGTIDVGNARIDGSRLAAPGRSDRIE